MIMPINESVLDVTLKPQPSSDFYVLADNRHEDLELCNENQMAEGQMWSGTIDPESERIYERVMQAQSQFDPTLAALKENKIYKDGRCAYTADMVHSDSFFNTRRPEQLDDIETIFCIGPAEFSWYTVVSAQWKNAIEEVEPQSLSA
jgi:hypothetical protein